MLWSRRAEADPVDLLVPSFATCVVVFAAQPPPRERF